jgi:hypothetical protein
VLLLRARAGRISPALWLDGLITALAVAAVSAALVLGVVASTEGSFATVATNLAYPLGDAAAAKRARRSSRCATPSTR